MSARRIAAGAVASILLAALAVSPPAAPAQTSPATPAPPSLAEQNAAIVRPLIEIGRVRARSPYCAALVRARPGIDSAVTYEYSVPVISNDLRHFRLDSDLTRTQSLDRLERDLRALTTLAQTGRSDVQALRAVANAEGDATKRREMLEFADALDGAKERQMSLARSIANIVGQLGEAPARVVANAPSDEHGAMGLSRARQRYVPIPTPTPPPQKNPGAFTAAQADAITDQDRLQQLFSAFAAEEQIRNDLKTAAQHGTNAMQLGNCERT
jgi:hypothetical protein